MTDDELATAHREYLAALFRQWAQEARDGRIASGKIRIVRNKALDSPVAFEEYTFSVFGTVDAVTGKPIPRKRRS